MPAFRADGHRAAARSIIDALDEQGVSVLSSCLEGVCGTCETRVLEGIPDHRDSLLSEDERRSNEYMMVCVSRSKSIGWCSTCERRRARRLP